MTALLILAPGCTGWNDASGGPSATSVSVPPAAQSLSERTELIAECLRSEGLSIEVTYDGGQAGFTYDNRIVSQELFDESYRACESQLVDAGEISPPPSGDPVYLATVYDRLTEAAQCLRSEGVDVPDPPSKQAWVESRGAAWEPFAALAQMASSEAARLSQLCGL